MTSAKYRRFPVTFKRRDIDDAETSMIIAREIFERERERETFIFANNFWSTRRRISGHWFSSLESEWTTIDTSLFLRSDERFLSLPNLICI